MVMDLPIENGQSRPHLGVFNDQLHLIWRTDEGVWIQRRNADSWSEPRLEKRLSSILDVAEVGDHLLLVTQDEPDSIALHMVQHDGLAELARLPRPEEPWSLIGHGGQGVLVQAGENVEFSHIDLLDGTQSSWTEIPEGSVLGLSSWSVLLAFGISGLVLVILLRGSSSNEMTWPEGSIPMAPLGRLIALGIDAIPGFVVTFVWFGAKPGILFDAFSFSLVSDEWITYGILILITCSWSFAWELAIGTSIGKYLLGAYLSDLDGGSPSFRQLALRSFCKFVMLLFPILMVTALRPPCLQSLGDQIAGVLVLEPSKHKSSDSEPGNP